MGHIYPLLCCLLFLLASSFCCYGEGFQVDESLRQNTTVLFAAAARRLQASTCELGSGRWIPAPRKHYPYGPSCPFIPQAENCVSRGRSVDYLRYRWQPANCQLNRFDAAKFLSVLAGKVVALVGDSMIDNFNAALRCSIHALTPTQDVALSWGQKKGYIIPQARIVVSKLFSPFLAQYLCTNCDKSQPAGGFNFAVNVDVVDPALQSAFANADVIIFTTGSWYRDGPPKSRMYYHGNTPAPGLSDAQAVNTILQTIQNFRSVNKVHGFPIFLTSPAAHTSCRAATGPWSGKKGQSVWRYDYNAKIRNGERGGLEAGAAFPILDVSYMSLLRPDAHSAQLFAPGAADCTHWCVPGIPDTWLDFMFTTLGL